MLFQRISCVYTIFRYILENKVKCLKQRKRVPIDTNHKQCIMSENNKLGWGWGKESGKNGTSGSSTHHGTFVKTEKRAEGWETIEGFLTWKLLGGWFYLRRINWNLIIIRFHLLSQPPVSMQRFYNNYSHNKPLTTTSYTTTSHTTNFHIINLLHNNLLQNLTPTQPTPWRIISEAAASSLSLFR